MKMNKSPQKENIEQDIQPKPELEHIFKVSKMIEPKVMGKLNTTINDLKVRREELQEEKDAREKYTRND